MQTLTINNQAITVKEYKGQRVVTFKDVDLAHGRNEGRARKRFRDNKKHFQEGVDFFKITPSEFRTAIGHMDLRQQNEIVLLTKSGYLMLVKSFTDDLAWKVQRELVNNYFRAGEPEQLTLPEYTYQEKTYKGVLVLTIRDLEHFTKISKYQFAYYLKTRKSSFRWGVDAWFLKGSELREFKAENQAHGGYSNCLYIVSASGIRKLETIMGSGFAIPKLTTVPTKEPLEINLKADNSQANALIESTIKEIGALDLLVKRLQGFHTRDEVKEIQACMAHFQSSAFQKIAALTLLEV